MNNPDINLVVAENIPSSQPGIKRSDISLRARHAQRSFNQWYLEKHQEDDIFQMHKDNTWGSESRQSRETFQMFGEDILVLWDRFESLEDYEKETLNDLRDKDISIPDLMSYVRAEPGFNPEGKPVRVEVASAFRKREFLEKSQRIEDSGRSAALAIGAVGMLAVGSWVVTSGIFPGIEAAAFSVTQWVKPAWEMASDLVHSAAGGGAMILAWKAWKELQEIRGGVQRLDLGKDSDFSDLPNSLGKIDYNKLNDQYESIPTADQHLIKHLSPTELRMFLNGKDATRLHILRSNPPSPWAKVQSRLDPVAHGDGFWLGKLMMAAWTVIASPWHREKNNARVPDLNERMANWRAFAKINRAHTENGPDRPTYLP